MFLGCEVKPPENGDTLAQKAVVTGTSSNGKKFVVSGWHSCRLSELLRTISFRLTEYRNSGSESDFG